MKLLLDQNLSYKLVDHLKECFPDSEHVKTAKLHTKPDAHIWEYAKKHGFVIVTQDSDFNDLLLKFGPPPKIIWIRVGNVRAGHIKNLLLTHFSQLEVFITQNVIGCYMLYDKSAKKHANEQ